MNRPVYVYIVENYAQATSAVLLCVALTLLSIILAAHVVISVVKARSAIRVDREMRKPR